MAGGLVGSGRTERPTVLDCNQQHSEFESCAYRLGVPAERILRHAADRCGAHGLDAGKRAGPLHFLRTPTDLHLATTRLPSALREALGPHAAEDLVTIVDEMRAEHADFRAEFAEFRREMQTRFQAIDTRFDRVDQRFQALETKLGDVKADLMKWSFVFWVGAVTAIAVLAGVLER